MIRGIYIDIPSSTIYYTRDVARNLKVVDSPEAMTLLQYRKLFPSFYVKPKTVSKYKVNHNGLSIPFMLKIVKRHPDHETLVGEFEETVRHFKGQPGYYSHVKSWFLENLPEYTAMMKEIKATERRIAEERTRAEEVNRIHVESLEELFGTPADIAAAIREQQKEQEKTADDMSGAAA